MQIKTVRVTPIAIKDPPLLNAAGVHEPWGLRAIIEVEGVNGLVGLGETYGDAPVLDLLLKVAPALVGMSAYEINALMQTVRRLALVKTANHVEMELAPGSLGSNLISSVFSAFEVAFLDLQARTQEVPMVQLLGGAIRKKVSYSAYLFYKWDASVDPEYASDPYGEAVNPDQIVAQARQMIDTYGFESIKLKAVFLIPLLKQMQCLLSKRHSHNINCELILIAIGPWRPVLLWQINLPVVWSITKTQHQRCKVWLNCTNERGYLWRPIWW